MEEFLHHYHEILTDPAHLAVELTLMLLVDVLFLGLIWPLVRRAIKHEHLVIDEEHGVDHHSDEESLTDAQIRSRLNELEALIRGRMPSPQSPRKGSW